MSDVDLATAQLAHVVALESASAVALRAMEAAMDERSRMPWWRPLRRRVLDARAEMFFGLAGAFAAKVREQDEAARAEAIG